MKKLYVVREQINEEETEPVAVFNTRTEAEEFCLALWQSGMYCAFCVELHDFNATVEEALKESDFILYRLLYVDEVAYIE